jgi:hypothetical protein
LTFSPENTSEFALQVERLYGDQLLRDELAQNAYRLISRDFDSERTIAQIDSYFSQLMGDQALCI